MSKLVERKLIQHLCSKDDPTCASAPRYTTLRRSVHQLKRFRHFVMDKVVDVLYKFVSPAKYISFMSLL